MANSFQWPRLEYIYFYLDLIVLKFPWVITNDASDAQADMLNIFPSGPIWIHLDRFLGISIGLNETKFGEGAMDVPA